VHIVGAAFLLEGLEIVRLQIFEAVEEQSVYLFGHKALQMVVMGLKDGTQSRPSTKPILGFAAGLYQGE
jgi:hypothetical protein